MMAMAKEHARRPPGVRLLRPWRPGEGRRDDRPLAEAGVPDERVFTEGWERDAVADADG